MATPLTIQTQYLGERVFEWGFRFTFFTSNFNNY